MFADVSRQILDQMRQEVQNEDRDRLLATDEEEYVAYLVAHWRIEPLGLDIKHPKWSEGRKEIPASQLRKRGVDVRHGGSHPMPTYVCHVPYSGNEILFQCAPSGGIMRGVHTAVVEGGFLTFEIVRWEDGIEAVKRKVEQTLAEISANYSQLHGQVVAFNQQLEVQARQAARARKAWCQSQKDQLASLGEPFVHTSTSSTVKIVPVKASIKSGVRHTAPADEWLIDNAVYRQILDIIQRTGVEMERHPGVYEGKDEETLRDHLITVLSPHFQSVTGETFNKAGKTDILIRHEGKNVFVAECKFWSGVSGYYETIDQILRYLTWRDSKAAVICFIQNKELDPVLRQIESETAKHVCFAKRHKKTDDGWYDFDFHLKDDATRNVKLAVLCFHFPN
jgi:hypothetical protein